MSNPKTLALKRTIAEFGKDQCTDLAAGLTYYAVLALFPAILALVSLLGVFGQGPETAKQVMDLAAQSGITLPEQIQEPITQLVSAKQSAGIALVSGLVLALWSASGYVGAFGRALNRMYEVPEGRPIWKLRPMQVFVTLIMVAIVALIATGLVVSGGIARTVGDLIGLGDTSVLIWSIAKWPVMVALVVLLVALLYHLTPNVKKRKFKWLSLGAFVGLATWAVLTVGFGFYVANFSSYNKTYGSLAGVIIFLLWLWISNVALLFGAELDAELQRTTELEEGLPAERELQLPMRDDRASRKREAKLNKTITAQRQLRESNAAESESADDSSPAHEERGATAVDPTRPIDLRDESRTQR